MCCIYSDGKKIKAVLLRRSGNSMRLAVQGSEDVVEVVNVHGTWWTDEFEPVDIEFEWQKSELQRIGGEDSQELASRLAYSLLAAAGQSRSQLPS